MLGWLLPEEPASRRVCCQESIEILRLVEINGVEHGGACMGQSELANFCYHVFIRSVFYSCILHTITTDYTWASGRLCLLGNRYTFYSLLALGIIYTSIQSVTRNPMRHQTSVHGQPAQARTERDRERKWNNKQVQKSTQ